MSEFQDVVRGGFWLFLDIVVVSLEGWIFWLIVSPLTTPDQIGYATTVIRLAALTTGFLGLGLDYSLLKEISRSKAGLFGSAITFEIFLLTAVSPVVFLVGTSIYGTNIYPFISLGILLMLFQGAVFISRNSALGLLQSRRVFIYSSLGALLRIIIGVWLLTQGLGGLGIVTASLAQQTLMAIALISLCYFTVGFGFGNLNELKNLIKLGLSNFPGKIPRIAINNLTVILLAAITSDPTTVGVFYIALTMSLIAGALSTSLATMALPTSTIQNSDVTDTSLKLGLYLTAPVISALITAPAFPLSLVGKAYTSASNSLAVLALAVIPTTLTLNAVTKLNHKKMLRQLTYLGAIQLLVFIIPFFTMVSAYQGFGAALTVLISSIAGGIASYKWLGKTALKPAILTLVTVTIGWTVGTLATRLSPILAFAAAFTTSTVTILTLKGITIKEIKQILKSIK